ncbi:MAG: hypothetical protein QM647_10060 [Asticcacaulis sp.]|uniref:hypothetical protein n=1 Tax=Asticcacaulis sp. TaxID=1872648 RepID=UPI0039E45847
MKALQFIEKHTRGKGSRGLYVTACLFPVVAGVIAKLKHHSWMYMDVDAVICAARAVGIGHSAYGIVAHSPFNPVCPGLTPAAYVYAPQIARTLAPLVGLFGAHTLHDLYLVLLLAPATAFMLWFALIRTFPGVAPTYRWLAFAALSPMTFCCANIGIVMHATVVLSLVAFRNRKLPFIATVLACAYIKPSFLSYLIILLIQDRSWLACARAFACTCLCGVGVVWLSFIQAASMRSDWLATLRSVAIQEQPGLGWFALAEWLGIGTGTPLHAILTLAYMAVAAGSGILIGSRFKWSDDERILIGLGTAVFLNPRLMDYDMIILVPYAALLATLANQFRNRVLSFNLSWGFALPLAFGIFANAFHIKSYHRTHTAMFVFFVMGLVIAIRCAQTLWLDRSPSQLPWHLTKLFGKPCDLPSQNPPGGTAACRHAGGAQPGPAYAERSSRRRPVRDLWQRPAG